MTPDLTEHTGFSFSNASNFDVRRSEIDHVLDVPVYPAQNLILDTQSANVYSRPPKSPLFIYDDRIFMLMSPDPDQRFLMMEYGETSRTLKYKFGGRVYPQSRPNAGFSMSPSAFWLFGGNVGGKDDMRDLWEYDMPSSTWVPHFDTGEDQGLSEFPADRRGCSLLVDGAERLIFGGRTYIEIGNTVVPLNDLWLFDGVAWSILDPMAALPRADGVIVYNGANVVRILSDNSIYTVYKDGTTPTTVLPYSGPPAPVPSEVVSLVSDGTVYLVDYMRGTICRWDDGSGRLVVVKTQSFGVGYDGSSLAYYEREQTVVRRRGLSEYQPEIRIYMPSINNWADDLPLLYMDIDAVPLGSYMAVCDLPDGRKYMGLGLRDDVFIEDHFIYDASTNNCAKVGSSGVKPQERLLAGCCYDKARRRIWLFGGYTGSLYYNDLWYLSVDTLTWTRVRRRSAGGASWPKSRARAGMCVIEDTLWIVSGYSDTKSYSDLWKYDIENDQAVEESLSDWVAFGTEYHLFEWRDRMWLFNGEFKLYRYFYEDRQFAPVTIYATRYPAIQQKIEGGEYITPPMTLSVQGDSLIISYRASTGDWSSFFVDMDSKEIIQYPGLIYTASLWGSRYSGMDTSGFLYFYNVSPFDFAQRNTTPYYEYAFSPVKSRYPLSRDSCFLTYWDEDMVGGAVPRPCYVDASSMYVIYTDQIEYSPLIPSFGDMESQRLLCNYWPQTDFSVLDGTTGIEQSESKLRVGSARFRTLPRFVWKRVPSRYAERIRRASMTWQDDASRRTYVLNDQDGHIVRYRASDGTFFNYPSKIWGEGSAAHRGNVVFCFGGNSEQASAPPGIGQDGQMPRMTAKQWATLSNRGGSILCHSGLMMYDLNYMSFQLRLIADHKDLEPRNYDQIKTYLVGVARNQLGIGTGLSSDWVAQIEASVYSSTLSLVGDLSVRNIVGEQGERPFGYRCSCISAQAGDLMYIGGGAFKWGEEVGCTCNPAAPCTKVHYANGFPLLDQASGKYVRTEYKDFYAFNTSTRSWRRLSDMPSALYGGTTVLSPDSSKIYVVGGFEGDDLSNASNNICIYDVARDSWSRLLPMPAGYEGRGLPSVTWIDEYRMLIVFGCKAQRSLVAPSEFIRMAIPDAWIVDTVTATMYKAFECSSKTSIMLDSIEDPNGYIHMLDLSRVWINNLYDKFSLSASLNKLVYEGNNALITGTDGSTPFDETNFSPANASTPRSLIWSTIDPVDGSVVRTKRIDVPDSLAGSLSPTAIVKDFVDPRGDLWLVVNRLVDVGGGHRRHNLSFYRAAKEDEYRLFLSQLPVDIPVDAGVKLVGYDGNKYLYCIWNEFNIWQLDLETAIFSPNSEYWRRLPPYPDLVDMGIVPALSQTTYTGMTKSTMYEGDLLFYNAEGLVSRFNTANFVWYMDRYPDVASGRSVVKDGAELYYFRPGSVYGTLIGLEHKQEDKFYFDAELLEPNDALELPVVDAIIDDMTDCVLMRMAGAEMPSASDWLAGGFSDMFSQTCGLLDITPSSLWDGFKSMVSNRRSTVRRNRILAMNRNNHMLRAWTKKHGRLDLYLEFDSYYPVASIDLSVDYDTMNEQSHNYAFTCWTSTGVQSGIGTASQEDSGYDWDPFARTYRKMVQLGDGYTYVESERPNYLVRFPLAPGSSLNRLRLEFTPVAREFNYISRLNHIGIRHVSATMGVGDDSGDLSVLAMEPFGGIESDVYMVRISNKHPTHAASNVCMHLVRNHRILLSLDQVSWKMATQDDQLVVTQSLDPGAETAAYIKALSYMDKSNIDLVVTGQFPQE